MDKKNVSLFLRING